MATVESSVVKAASVPTVERIPVLCAGDRLTRAEFERRYLAMPNVKKAELIEGVVYMPSPVSDNHACPHAKLVWLLGHYWHATPGVEISDNGTVRLDLENEPQPDVLRVLPEFGGQSRMDDGYIAGPPEFIAEISVSSVSYDLHDKLRAYQRNGVREYLVWRVWDSAIDWFGLREDRYERLPPTEAGYYQSEALPGLWLDLSALLRGDFPHVLSVLQKGLASPEHAVFVARLNASSGGARS